MDETSMPLSFQTCEGFSKIKLWHKLEQVKAQSNQKATRYLNAFAFPLGRIGLLNDNLKT